jgi:hypothetical protein
MILQFIVCGIICLGAGFIIGVTVQDHVNAKINYRNKYGDTEEDVQKFEK